MDGDLVRGLRSRGIDVVTAAEAGMIRRKDEEHLSLASDQRRALYSFNVRDFHEIHTKWTGIGRNHTGIILAQPFWLNNSATRPENRFGDSYVSSAH